MKTRKIQQVGGGTYTVSIPVHWAEEHDIEAGNTAYLFTHRDGSLVVRWKEREHSELAATEIELDGTDPETVARMLRAAYTAGFKQIHLSASGELTSAQRRAIDTSTRGLTGVEITEESAHHVTVQGLLDANDVSIRQSAIQLKHITLSTYEAALDFFAGETTEAEHIIARRDEADRVFQHILRHLNRSLLDWAELDQLGTTRPQLFEYYGAARQFERIVDHAVRIARCVQRTEHTVSGELVTESRAIGCAARDIIEEAFTAIINGESTELAHSALDGCECVIQEARSLDRTLVDRTPAEAHILTRILDSIVRTLEYAGNIANLALRASFRT